MANKKQLILKSSVELKGRVSNTEVLTEESYEKLNNGYQLLIKIALSDEIGMKMEDLRVGKYNENYYLANESVMLINETIFGE